MDYVNAYSQKIMLIEGKTCFLYIGTALQSLSYCQLRKSISKLSYYLYIMIHMGDYVNIISNIYKYIYNF